MNVFLWQLQLVLECGCDVNCRNGRQETPLMFAMISTHGPDRIQAEIQLLLQYGADINCRNLRGQTPFMYACVLNQICSLEILMKSVSTILYKFSLHLVRPLFHSQSCLDGMHFWSKHVINLLKPGPSCSKLTTSLVNVSLKFQTSISEVHQYFLLKKCEKLLQCKSFSHIFNKKFQCISL